MRDRKGVAAPGREPPSPCRRRTSAGIRAGPRGVAARGLTNSKLARIAARALELQGATIDYATMREFDTPSYDQGVQDTGGIPAGAVELRRRLESADAFVIASP